MLLELNGPKTWTKKMENRYEEWNDIVEKVEKDIEHGKKTIIQIEIAVECQKQTLEFAKKERAKFTEKKPLIKSIG